MSLELQFRWVTGYLLTIHIGLAIYSHWRARAADSGAPRASESPLATAARWLTAAILIGPLLVYLIYPSLLFWSRGWFLEQFRWLGAALSTASMVLIFWGLKTLGANNSATTQTRPGQSLVTTGPYHLIRHPLYSLNVLFFLGIAILSGNWLMIATVAASAMLIARVIVPAEEKALVVKFADQYRDYIRNAGRMAPQLNGRERFVYTVPNRFGVAAVLMLTTTLALLFGSLKFMRAPTAAYLFVGSQIVAICLVQIFIKRAPRLGSTITGAILLPLWIYLELVRPGFFQLLTDEQIYLLLAFSTAFGGLIGYCTGALAAGFFLLLDLLEQISQPHEAGDASELSPVASSRSGAAKQREVPLG